MSLHTFHPAVSEWFRTALGEPTAAQAQGWPAIRQRRHTLIAAPTGSGKTLAAFLTALDDLFREGLEGPLADEVRVVYVSPLKALSADIHKNLAEPRRGIRVVAEQMGLTPPRITAAVRTGDTTQSERDAILRRPPHILVTTPESLYLLLTASRSRAMLRTVRTVIVDEIHAVIGTRRGAHLALSVERLARVADRPLLRLGLSATQKPIDEVARYLVGTASAALPDACLIVNEGHRRAMDLGLEMPQSPLEAVMSHEVWAEYYARLTDLVRAHRTTLVFVNTRRMAERLARELSERLGEDAVTAHHGSLSKETRLDAESRLKNGQLKALVATASLELGIDIGHVDLVCQIGSPHRIATFLQRVGRSGHTVSGLPKGRLFAASRDDLVECAALLRAVRRGELDAIVTQDCPLDVLAQQLVSEAAAEESSEAELLALARGAWPYRALEPPAFERVLQMIADGFSTRRGRRAALVHRDEVNGRVRGRRGSRSLAITSGGAIPEVADYRVLLDPDDTFVGTLNEDFAIESTVGDVFQLGNAAWQVLQVGPGVVRVRDARGAPPTLPFWLGEAPARSDELSHAVSELRLEIDGLLRGNAAGAVETAIAWVVEETGLSRDAAEQLVAYLVDGQRALGALPTQETLILERFFDESGGMQLVLHAPFGSRINKAWGLALRKRFCRQFNFELQAAATEDGLLLSLGPQHSFPLADVFRYLHPATVRDILVQAFLDAPVFQTRWRWATTIALAVPRNRHGKKVAPQLQRMMADDLMAAAFPDAAACLENIPGDRQIPDHPLVQQAIHDCLHEAMDFHGLLHVLDRIHRGAVTLLARDTVEPSPLCHELLNARPYAFLDDAPLEERRAHAVYTRRAGEPGRDGDLGALDAAAIARVVDEQRPDPRDADELHDALVTAGFLRPEELAGAEAKLVDELVAARRVARTRAPAALLVAAERLPEMAAVAPDLSWEPAIDAPLSRREKQWACDAALVELMRGRLSLAGPTTAAELAAPLGIAPERVDAALIALESEGVVLRGSFRPVRDTVRRTAASAADESHFSLGTSHAHSAPSTPHSALDVEWCDRRLLARIHRYTLNRLRAEIEPVAPADFMRFLFEWQHVAPRTRLTGSDGLLQAIRRLDGCELAAGAWERQVLPARVDRYESSLLDLLCLTGQVGWARLSESEQPTRLGRATPIALFLRDHGTHWKRLAASDRERRTSVPLSLEALTLLDALRSRGASFAHELAASGALALEAVHGGLADLVSAGLVTSDGFAGLRALIADTESAARMAQAAGRWSHISADDAADAAAIDQAVEYQARALLNRYGVICRRLLLRETQAQPWRVLVRVYRRLEARGEIRGGRFVSGLSGEQFAVPEAVAALREVRRQSPDGAIVVISAADPLNLAGILNAAERVAAIASTRIAYRDGVPLAALEGDYMRPLAAFDTSLASDVASALAGRRVPPVVSGFVGRVS
jgi:ATP-dependent Lhr-like helicase